MYPGATAGTFVDPVAQYAMHEFGHVLGLFDAYKNIPFTNREADSSHAIINDVMIGKGIQKVYSYNIAMMLYAFNNNELQNYANASLLGVTSQVFYRMEVLK